MNTTRTSASAPVRLTAAGPGDKSVLARLLQLYLYDFSEFRPAELSAQGTYEYRYFDHYFTGSADREAYLITAADRLAGFALARRDVEGDEGTWNISEFFVVRRHRRRGVAREAARLLFQRHPGPWTLSYLSANAPAASLWPAVADAVSPGPVVRTEGQPSDDTTLLRFHVHPARVR
ncbi:GNAT family N-acetyltransferase [Streptomyces sp. NPDC059398]|uniref:GNAT family N-acetyltransferase n=1 Tax=Streptomyces sp. NPDC059398 TaxID=3346820 RepID=UPI00369E0589